MVQLGRTLHVDAAYGPYEFEEARQIARDAGWLHFEIILLQKVK
jgi:hypothetical protein